MRSDSGEILYIGKAKNLKKRVLSYFQKANQHTEKTRALVQKINSFETIIAPTELDAFIIENSLIKEHQPPYNIMLRDDKTYPYLKLTADAYPRLILARKISDDKARYFGPYTSGGNVKSAINLIRSTFKLRNCPAKEPGRPGNTPCLDYHMHKCLAPCIYELEDTYKTLIAEVTLILSGKNFSLRDSLQQEMEQYSARHEFEQAGVCRDKLKALSMVMRRQPVVFKELVDLDSFGLARSDNKVCAVILSVREGALNNVRRYVFEDTELDDSELLSSIIGQAYNKALSTPPELSLPVRVSDTEVLEAWLKTIAGKSVKLTFPERGHRHKIIKMAQENAKEMLLNLDDNTQKDQSRISALQKALHLDNPPRRIEAFDISNLMGKQMVASKVSFWEGKPDKSQYRKYIIKTVDEGPNDTAAMYEVLGRRLRKISTGEELAPDLILVDGGIGQLNVAVQARLEAGLESIPLIGLAKREEEIYLPHNPIPLKLPKNIPALLLLRHIRDEAHRFAITFHRKKRGKAMFVG